MQNNKNIYNYTDIQYTYIYIYIHMYTYIYARINMHIANKARTSCKPWSAFSAQA